MSDSQKPYVICHMMQTLDGKIASGVPGVEIIMDYFNTYTEIEKEFYSKVWMFGRKTAEAFAESVGTKLDTSKESERTLPDGRDFIAEGAGKFAITIDTKGILRWKDNFINLSNQDGKFHLIVIVTNQTPKEYLAYLEKKSISYILAGEHEVDFHQAVEKLNSLFSIEKILLEGGGSFNGSLMASGVIDEISLLLIPRVLNKKSAPSLFDQDTNEVHSTDYQLVNTKELENGVLWLRYKKI